MIKAVIYARVSTDKASEHSIEGQLRDCRAFAENNGYEIIGEYIDVAITGRTDNRPQFQQMIFDSKKKCFEKIIVWKLDRFSRDKYDNAIYKHALKGNGVKVISATEPIVNGPEGVLMEAILEGFAEYFSKELAIKVNRGLDLNADKCFSNGGYIPYGFITVPVAEPTRIGKKPKKIYKVNEEERPIVIEIFTRYANGERIVDICNNLNDRGIRTAKGAEFNKNSLTKMLKSEKYIGTYVYKERKVPDGIPRIISDELFREVQNRLQVREKTSPRKRGEEREPYLLTSKLFCGDCKSLMVGTGGTGRHGTLYRYYSCNGARNEKKCSFTQGIQKETLEEIVIEKSKAILTDENIEKIANETVSLYKDTFKNQMPAIIRKKIADNKREQENLLSSLKTMGHIESVALLTAQELEKLIEHEKMLKASLAEEELKMEHINKKQIMFYLHEIKNKAITNRKYRQAFISIFVKRVELYKNGGGLVYLNVQRDPAKIDESEIEKVVEHFDISSYSDYGSSPKSR